MRTSIHRRQPQSWQRYGCFSVISCRNRSRALRSRDGNSRVERQAGQIMKRVPRGEHGNATTAVAASLDAVRPLPIQSAKAAGLRYTSDTVPGIKRERHGAAFRYIGPDKKVIRNPEDLQRIRSLVIPPAW